MPPPNTPTPAAQQNGHVRKRTAPVVPAIPLALSKPRLANTKPQPKPEVDARGGAENATSGASPVEAVTVADEGVTAGNGLEAGETQANGVQTPAATPVTDVKADTPGGGPSPAPNGTQPGVVDGQTSRPSTASTPGDATATNSPELARKPTERFDMRHIRTELPPAFIPSAEQHTPRSNASSQSNRPPMMPSHVHPSHPSTSSIVFGGRDSLSSSPAPSQSAGSGYGPPPLPAFGSAPVSQYQPPGHAYHASEPHGQRTFHPGFPQPGAPWNVRQGYAAPPSHPAHTSFRYPPREAFTPVESPYTNGKLSRSASQASSAAADQPRSAHPLQSPLAPDAMQEPRSAYPAGPHPRQFNQHMPPPPPPDVASHMDNAEALRAHVLSNFADPSSADCAVNFIIGPDSVKQSFHGHRLILGRSPTLMQLLSKSQQATETGRIEAEAPIKSRHLKFPALNEALRYLYGAPLLQLDLHRPTSSAGERTLANIDRMEFALSYVAAGMWLRMPVIAGRGVEVAGSYLHWDTMPTALTFALEGGLSPVWTVDDGSEDPFSAASSDDSTGRPEITRTPAYEPYSTALLQRIMDFTIHVFPPNFYLDASAPQLVTCPRLPPLPQTSGHESRPSASDPRLSQIRFGEIPVGPSFTTTMISSILLSLPFQLLKAVLEHIIFAARLGSETAASIMRQVVAERERRRGKAHQARTAGKISSNADPQLLQNLYWEEFVEPSIQHKVGFRLARRRTGIDTPLSSGPE